MKRENEDRTDTLSILLIRNQVCFPCKSHSLKWCVNLQGPEVVHLNLGRRQQWHWDMSYTVSSPSCLAFMYTEIPSFYGV